MFFPAFRRVGLVHARVDFRKGHCGLLAASYNYGLSPYEGDLVVFVGRHKDRLKILAADTSGLWVWYKILNEGSIARDFKFLSDPTVSFIAPSAVNKLLEGTKFQVVDQAAGNKNLPP
ncbi:MAG: IS66 family insertion sequence element accessory protein TnpB [Pseudobdellovibrionaceae bacterium]|nr:IS66 family insertion sequence element accessory protein TnpB [Pseudobdellovibrionaceae bacterium]